MEQVVGFMPPMASTMKNNSNKSGQSATTFIYILDIASRFKNQSMTIGCANIWTPLDEATTTGSHNELFLYVNTIADLWCGLLSVKRKDDSFEYYCYYIATSWSLII